MAALGTSSSSSAPSALCDYLFVYGTLKQGEVNHHHWLAPYIRRGGCGGGGTATNTTAAVSGGGADQNKKRANTTRKKSEPCDCYLVFAGTARTRQRYPFFTNTGVVSSPPSSSLVAYSTVGLVGGTCSPCVVDAPIHDDDLSRQFVAAPPAWQGCAATVDEQLAAKEEQLATTLAEEVAAAAAATTAGGAAVGPASPSSSAAMALAALRKQQQNPSTPKNKYYNIFPQRVTGEVYRVVRCARCLSAATAAVPPSSVASGAVIIEGSSSSSVSSDDCSTMMRDFDELECTRHGVYTRRPIAVEVMLRSAADRSNAESAGLLFASSSSPTTATVTVASGADGGGNSATRAAAASAALKSKVQSAVTKTATALSGTSAVGIPTAAMTSSAGSSVASPTTAPTVGGAVAGPLGASSPSSPIITAAGAAGQPSAELLLPANITVTADVYFRTDKYPRSQLVEMLKRCVAGPARAKVEGWVEPLVTPEEAVATPNGNAKADDPSVQQQQQQQQHIQGFLSNFSVARSLALSYPRHYCYVPPHLRATNTVGAAGAGAGGDDEAVLACASPPFDVSALSSLLRQLPPSVLRSGGEMPSPMVLVILDGMGDYSGHSLRAGCDAAPHADAARSGGGGGGGDGNLAPSGMLADGVAGASSVYYGGGGGENGQGHGACLPTQPHQTNLPLLPSALTTAAPFPSSSSSSSAAVISAFSPLEMASLLHGNINNTNINNTNSAAPAPKNDDDDGLHIITRNGFSGMMDPCSAGLACGSDTAHLNLLGFAPQVYYRGRGSFETIGSGLSMRAGDIAFKCNFATMAHNKSNYGGDSAAGATATTAANADADADAAFFSCPSSTPIVVNRRADREFTREGPILCEALNGTVVTQSLEGRAFRLGEGPPPGPRGAGGGAAGRKYPPLSELFFGAGGRDEAEGKGAAAAPPLSYEILVRYATEHRCGVVIRGPHLSDGISGTDPLINNKALLWCVPTVKAPSAELLEGELYSKFIVKTRHAKATTAGDGGGGGGGDAAATTTPTAIVEIVDAKLGLPLSDRQKHALVEREKQLWAPFHSAVLTSEVVNAASAAMTRKLMHHDINLKERLPQGKALANVVLLRGAAQLSEKMPSFMLRYGLRPVALAPTAIIKGLVTTAGFGVMDGVEGATGSYDSNLSNKAKAIVALFEAQSAEYRRLFSAAFGVECAAAATGEEEEAGRDASSSVVRSHAPSSSLVNCRSRSIVERVIANLRRSEPVTSTKSRVKAAVTSSSSAGEGGGSVVSVESAVTGVESSPPTTFIDMGADGDRHHDYANEDDGASVELVSDVNMAALQQLADFVANEMVDFAFLHVKGTDDAGHDKDLPKRVAMAAKAGEAVLKALWEGLPVGSTIAVTADHTTPVVLGDHSTECVPFSVAKKKKQKKGANTPPRVEMASASRADAAATSCNSRRCGGGDGTPFFTEACCELYGSLGRFHGKHMVDVMHRVHDGESVTAVGTVTAALRQ